MKNIGRPPVFTELITKKLEEAFVLGCSDREACFYAGISPASLYNYQVLNTEFAERKKVLKSAPILKARKCVVNALEKDPNLAYKYLERFLKKEPATLSVEPELLAPFPPQFYN